MDICKQVMCFKLRSSAFSAFFDKYASFLSFPETALAPFPSSALSLPQAPNSLMSIVAVGEFDQKSEEDPFVFLLTLNSRRI